MWDLKDDISECLCNNNRLTDTENILVFAKGAQGRERAGSEDANHFTYNRMDKQQGPLE